MTISDEGRGLWEKLQTSTQQIVGFRLPTRGLGGRASGKGFTPSEFKKDRLYLKIEGRIAHPKQPTFVRRMDFDVYLLFKAGQLTAKEAKKLSFRTSYVGPILDRLQEFNTN